MSGVTDLDTTDPQPSANGPTVNRRDDAILAPSFRDQPRIEHRALYALNGLARRPGTA